MFQRLLPIAMVLSMFHCQPQQHEVRLHAGMTIDRSVTIVQDTFFLPGGDSLDVPIITITGEDITVDFNGAVLVGHADPTRPDQFSGLAIRVEGGRNITLQNLKVRGYKVGILAEAVDSITLRQCDLSYLYRPRLNSLREREDISDWLSYHQNDADEWLRYGAGVYLKNCSRALVRDLRITGTQNGLMLTGCDDGWFYNNDIRFNSGIGIGLYRCSRNRIMHNKLDWNVRGYSHGFYSRGQDSAGILCYEQSHDNLFAYNSATHSGDGFFLWAGQSTMDTGDGGCNGNLLYRNDFSHAPTNGVEVTFSSNLIVDNRIEECRYGIWGGYSFRTLIAGNQIARNTYGLAIEHGQENEISGNLFWEDSIGIQLWERNSQPADWGYAQARDVSSRDYRIDGNLFLRTKIPLKAGHTKAIALAGNTFFGHKTLLEETAPNTGLVQGDSSFPLALPDTSHVRRVPDSLRVAPLPDGQDAFLEEGALRGRSYILMHAWGPYDFGYPSVWLRALSGNRYTFLLLGPAGNWKISGGKGWTFVNPHSGTFPATVVAEKEAGATLLELEFAFIGEAFTDVFGRTNRRGQVFPFSFSRFEPDLEWTVGWHPYDSLSDPLLHEERFMQLASQRPAKQETTPDLAYYFWGAPGKEIPADRFATFAHTEVDLEAGSYRIQLTSDDGVRLWVDGKRVIDHWDVHTPATDEVVLELGGRHRFEIAHFDQGGFSTLTFHIAPLPKEAAEKE